MTKRIAVIEKDKCNPEGCGGYLCIRVSPGNRMGKEVFVVGPDGKAQVNEDICTDAESVTVKKCPFNAIHMIKLPEQLTTRPVHRYGKDGFILYSLPSPMFGSIVGILGVNGIGKSTAVSILSQSLKPNLGEHDNPHEFSDLIKYFKGSEAQVFFENLSKGKVRISYKPQAVDTIPKQYSGKVRKLLHGADAKKKLEEFARELEIESILDSDVSEISGGELQRVAIAAASLKDADVYFFDEPTSYLDIYQRINVSRFLRKLVTESRAVVVVEHDLIILDYLTDLVAIMYGEAGAYGIVSQPKPTRTAVNVYLSGYLREENMRFRSHEIKFASKPPQRLLIKEGLVSWSNVEKRLGNFVLKAAGGEIPRKHVIGVLGPNGTGKTTFMKLLAGAEKLDKGEINAKLTVSYKPQYLSSSSELLVKEHINAGEVLESQLNLAPLMLKRLNTLSGGELQRVAIADCLSKEADLYLLDEPSAYLDVEQRLIVSKVIRERIEHSGKTAVVVDHDLLFLDYLSDSLMVFDGVPAKSGKVNGPFAMEEGMNLFLSNLQITLRRDKDSNRPRINKPDSRLDREQKAAGKLYYQ